MSEQEQLDIEVDSEIVNEDMSIPTVYMLDDTEIDEKEFKKEKRQWERDKLFIEAVQELNHKLDNLQIMEFKKDEGDDLATSINFVMKRIVIYLLLGMAGTCLLAAFIMTLWHFGINIGY